MQTGMPSQPNYGKVLTNPYDSSIQGPDLSPLRKAMMQRIAQQGQNQGQQSAAGLQRAGVHGADQMRGLADVMQGQAQARTGLEGELQQQDFSNRLAEMNAANSATLGQNNQLFNRYESDLGNFNQENQGRGDFWNGLASLGGSALGGMMGGMFGGGGKKQSQQTPPWAQQALQPLNFG
jgi:hypothetical protein